MARKTLLVIILLWWTNTVLSSNGIRYYEVATYAVADVQLNAHYQARVKQLLKSEQCVTEREIEIPNPVLHSMELGTPDRVSIIHCNTQSAFERIEEAHKNSDLGGLRDQAIKGLKRIRGKNIFFGYTRAEIDKQRLYIVKFSKFNELDFGPELRRINGELASFEFYRESLIVADEDPNLTIGVSYYEDPSKQAELVAQKGPEISAFNRTYLVEFLYLVGTAL